MLPKHEHWLPAFLVKLFEQYQWPFVESQTSLLITVYNIQRILPPVRRDVVFLERNGEHLVTWVVDGDAERLEDLDLRVRGWC